MYIWENPHRNMILRLWGEYFMQAIFNSKLFQASSTSQQNKIRAALYNPVNMELVQQLRSYLDEPYRDKSLLQPSEGDEVPDEKKVLHEYPAEDTEHAEAKIEETDRSESDATQNTNSTPGNSIDVTDDADLGEELEPPKEEPPTGIPVQESTAIVGSEQTQSISVDTLKGSINLREDTQGVNRILKKNDEIWIYYEDKVNLNNVMGSVIELVSALGYANLEFNRLARSDNAIVFQIVDDSTSGIETMEN